MSHGVDAYFVFYFAMFCSDEFILTLGSRSAQILSLAYMPLVSPLAPATCAAYDQAALPPTKKLSFESRVSTETAVPGMTLRTVLPDYKPPKGLNVLKGSSTSSNQQGLGDDGDKTDTPPPPKGPFEFVKRYWYILLPLVLANFVTSEPPAAEQQQEGAASTQQQQGTTAPAPAPAASSSSGGGAARKRRGKRG